MLWSKGSSVRFSQQWQWGVRGWKRRQVLDARSTRLHSLVGHCSHVPPSRVMTDGGTMWTRTIVNVGLVDWPWLRRLDSKHSLQRHMRENAQLWWRHVFRSVWSRREYIPAFNSKCEWLDQDVVVDLRIVYHVNHCLCWHKSSNLDQHVVGSLLQGTLRSTCFNAAKRQNRLRDNTRWDETVLVLIL